MTGKRRITKDSDVSCRRLTDTVPQNVSKKQMDPWKPSIEMSRSWPKY